MKILAIDIGRSKSVACDYEAPSANHTFETVSTTPAAFHDLILKRRPDVVVIEICPAAGWIHDLCNALGVKIEVASTNDEAWMWRKVKRKSDRDDGLKLAKLKAQNNITPVYMPKLEVRQWRALIHYRHRLVGESTGMRNRIRALLDQVAIALPSRSKGFSAEGRIQWRKELCRDRVHADRGGSGDAGLTCRPGLGLRPRPGRVQAPVRGNGRTGVGGSCGRSAWRR